MQSKVSIGVVLFGEKYLEESLPSLIQQDYPNVEFLLLDQEENTWSASTYIKKNLPKIDSDSRVKIETGKNLWHSGGHNQLIQQAFKNGADCYICASNDMLYPSDFVAKIVAELEKPENQKFGSATVKLLQWNNVSSDSPPDKGGSERSERGVLDSCGIGISKSHRFYDRGQGETDHGQFDQSEEIFGASGALAIFRKKALRDVEKDGQYFDERLHYKNDIDLAYRLQWLGWKSLYIPSVEVCHDRQLGRPRDTINFFKNRREQKNWLKENSAFGQAVVISKNFSSDFSWSVRFRTKLRMLALKIFALLFESDSQKGFHNFKKIQKELELSNKKVSPKEIERLMK